MYDVDVKIGGHHSYDRAVRDRVLVAEPVSAVLGARRRGDLASGSAQVSREGGRGPPVDATQRIRREASIGWLPTMAAEATVRVAILRRRRAGVRADRARAESGALSPREVLAWS
jgi:hypothetical protein